MGDNTINYNTTIGVENTDILLYYYACKKSEHSEENLYEKTEERFM